MADFKMGRQMQMTDVCTKLGVQPPNFDEGSPGIPPPQNF